jgi:PIN domain nuclease of toxin-antitoxin system
LRLLLDTHVLLGCVSDHFPLPLVFQEALSGHRESFVSVVSIWEIAIKYRLGKLGLAEPPATLPELINDFGFHIVAITLEQVLTELEEWPETQDPFDRLLLAICQVADLRLMTVDQKLRDHPLAWQPGSA